MIEKRVLVNVAGAQALDRDAAAGWGLHPFALVEAAGRACAAVLRAKRPALFHPSRPRIVVLAGSGNNAADALVMLRALLLQGDVCAAAAAVVFTKLPEAAEKTPLGEAALALEKLGVSAAAWNAETGPALLAAAGLVIDGIAGTGVCGPLRGAALEMTRALNAFRSAQGGENAPFVVSVDVPSGCCDSWRPGMPLVEADATLAIEPEKCCLYAPEARKHAGSILAAAGIFPAPLMEKYAEAELVNWKSAAARIPKVLADDYKYTRGVVEIRAGSSGAAGAAKLAALGAQAAGAGLVRLVVDSSLYPVLAPDASGIMVSSNDDNGRFKADAVLVGPGWGRGADRALVLQNGLSGEQAGVPLILDADALFLAKDLVFHGNALLTPHVGELAEYLASGNPAVSKAELVSSPIPVLRRVCAEKNVHILFKSHVLYIASPDGAVSVVDGMCPVLGTGGSGDVLAGLCAGIAARWRSRSLRSAANAVNIHACACAAASLLVTSARSKKIGRRFIDPAVLAETAGTLAGGAWLPASE